MNIFKRKNKKDVDSEVRKKTNLNERTPFIIQEAYKVARTNIMFAMPDDKCKKIVVTSSDAREGKTTTCVNLATSFAQTGSKVLIIECDFRTPKIHNVFDLTNAQGLSHILEGQTSAAEAIERIENKNLDIITAGHIPPNPSELLSSQAMTELLSELEKKYDYIFLDTPPINAVTDALFLAKNASGTVLVARQDKTRYKEIRDALERLKLADANMLGIILTGVKCKRKGYKRNGKYGYYKAYGA